MKKAIFRSCFSWFCVVCSFWSTNTATGATSPAMPPGSEKTENIIIRKKGDVKEKINHRD